MSNATRNILLHDVVMPTIEFYFTLVSNVFEEVIANILITSKNSALARDHSSFVVIGLCGQAHDSLACEYLETFVAVREAGDREVEVVEYSQEVTASAVLKILKALQFFESFEGREIG